MKDILKKILWQQEEILKRQSEILSLIGKLEDGQNLLNLKAQMQYDELNSRLEINERSTRQIDEQIAISNTRRDYELSDLKSTLEKLKTIEEFLRLDIETRLIDKAVAQ